MTLRVLVTIGLVAGVLGSASAQDPGQGQDKQKPAQGASARSSDAKLNGPMRILASELKLDQEQSAQVGIIWEAHSKAEQALRDGLRPSPELAERMGVLRREMRAAHDAGNKERIEALRKELEAIQEERTKSMTPLREKLDELQAKLHDDLMKVMREDQVEAFERVWSEQLDRREIRKSLLRNPNAIKAAVDRLKDLTPEQKAGIKNVLDAYKRWAREAREKPGAYAAARKDKMKKLYDDVLAQLTPDQREIVTKELDPDQRLGRERRGESKPGLQEQDPAKPEAKSEVKAETKQGGQ